MISTDLALALRDAGLRWHPASGDRFQLDEPEFEADVFTVSEMTIEPRSYPTGVILAFNGTTEWALDSVALDDALWLPREDQLRELLRRAFRSLRRLADTHVVEIALRPAPSPTTDGADEDATEGDATDEEVLTFEHPQPEDAYGLALLEVLRRLR